MKVKKLQAGGFMTYQPLPMVPRAQEQQVQQSLPEQQISQAPQSNGHLDESLIKQLLGKGITVDVMQFSNMVEQASAQYANMTELERNSNKGQQVRSILKGDMGMLNALIRSKDFFDNAISTAKSNKALEEFAVNQNGMIVKDSGGKIKTVSFEEYNKNKQEYYALTNAELAEEREFNKDLVGNTSVFSTLSYGKGMELVKEEISKILSNIGRQSTSVSNGQFQLSEAEASELASAAKDGVFKIKSGESITTNQPHLERAKQAMWLNLSENSRSVLRARAANIADSPGQIEKMAMTMAVSLLDPSEETSTSKTYDMSYNKGASGSGGGSGKLTDSGPNEMAALGRLNETVLSQIGDYGVSLENVGFRIPSTSYLGKEGNIVTLRATPKLADLGNLHQTFTVDGSPIDIDETSIVGNAYFTHVLVKTDGNGNRILDQEGSRRLAEYQREYRSLPQREQTPLKNSELMQKYGINSLNLLKVIVAEAASYDPKLWGSRDDKYFKNAGDKITKMMENIVPDSQGSRDWKDNPVNKHLIFIPAYDTASARFADENSAKLPESVYDLNQGFNSGTNGYQIGRGTNPYVQPIVTNNGRGADFFNN